MDRFHVFVASAAALVLFLFAIESFAHELQSTFKEQAQRLIKRATSNPLLGVLSGAFITAVVQSSSAISVITVSLVSTGAMSLTQSITLLMGSNIGTTLTAQLIAFKLSNLGPIFMILGYALNFFKNRFGVFGKPIFFFGMLLYGLDLLKVELVGFQEYPFVRDFLLSPSSPYWGLLAGIVTTFLLQSSSVVTGLIVVLVAQNFLQLDLAIAMIIGANVGTTGTALLASLSLGREAKQAAIANMLMNSLGCLLFIPLLHPFIEFIKLGESSLAQKTANAHLIFNVVTVVVLFPLRKKIAQLVERLIPVVPTDEKPLQ